MKVVFSSSVGMVVGEDWEIRYDECFEEFSWNVNFPCPHCYGEHTKLRPSIGSTKYYEVKFAYCPRVLSITPDDPYNGAVVCLDCLLEKLKEEGITDASSS